MLLVVAGFLFGLFIPFMARNYMVYQRSGLKFKKTRMRLFFKKYGTPSILWALAVSLLTFAVVFKFGENIWFVWFIWALMLLTAIDRKMQWLPDVITIPLLLTGFFSAVMGYGAISSGESAVGAILGYLLPFVASIFFLHRKEPAIGGGDIKLLSAVGAWLGIDVTYAIVFAALLFFLEAAIIRKRIGAFGPAIAVASIAVAFWAL